MVQGVPKSKVVPYYQMQAIASHSKSTLCLIDEDMVRHIVLLLYAESIVAPWAFTL